MKTIPFQDITSSGLLNARAQLSFLRLQEDYYQWESISRVNFEPFPGDAIGRAINGLTLLSQALHEPMPDNLQEIMRRVPELSNADGYLGPQLPASRANEDVLAAHNGYACGLTEYALWTKNPAATESLRRVVANLFVPARSAIACYRETTDAAAKMNWHLSGGDIGQLFLALDGMTRAYALVPTHEFKATIETAIDRYRKLDLVSISAQTHSMLSATIGSEGTLGIVTKVLLKLIPKPAARRTLMAVFATMESAAETVSAIIAAKIIPCTLEFLDAVTINCVEDFAKVGLPRDAAAILLIETDGHPAAVAEEADRMAELARQHGATSVQVAETAEQAAALATARRAAFSSLARVAPTTILEDATVPRSELAKMIRFIQETGQRHNLKIGTFGHMGDGNLHPTFLTNERNHEEMHRVELAMKEIFDFAVSLGGTITGEHGVGLAKKEFLKAATSDLNLEIMRRMKSAFDPAEILNPGKIFNA